MWSWWQHTTARCKKFVNFIQRKSHDLKGTVVNCNEPKNISTQCIELYKNNIHNFKPLFLLAKFIFNSQVMFSVWLLIKRVTPNMDVQGVESVLAATENLQLSIDEVNCISAGIVYYTTQRWFLESFADFNQKTFLLFLKYRIVLEEEGEQYIFSRWGFLIQQYWWRIYKP